MEPCVTLDCKEMGLWQREPAIVVSIDTFVAMLSKACLHRINR